MERLIELTVPGVVVGLIVLVAQLLIIPRMEKAKLIVQEHWKSKRDALLEAIRLIDRFLSTANWKGIDAPNDLVPSMDKPSGREINDVFSKLLLVAENSEIPNRFYKFSAKGHDSFPATRGEFILLLREELFKAQTRIKPEEVPYFF
jgi:hypothetical protein